MERTPATLFIIPYLRFHKIVYEATNGLIGKRLAGTPSLILTTTGRKTGQRRRSVLSYLRDGDSWVVVASNGGSDRSPAWLANMRANPVVEVQDGRKRATARARIADPVERARLWPMVNRNNRGLAGLFHPGARGRYDVYQKHTEREIPVVILTPE